MISNISRRKLRKLLRENSSESSLSKSISAAPDNLNELSMERLRGAIGKNNKRNDLSMKNIQALFKIYQMESNKLIDFAGFLSDLQTTNCLATISSYIPARIDLVRQKWYHILSLKFPKNFDNDCISLITLVHTILYNRMLDPVPSLLLLNYLIILTFWQDFGTLSMDKSNLLMDHLKGIIKAFIKIVKQNTQDLYNSNYLQLVENVGSELYPFLLTLFQIIKKKSNYYYCFICLSEIIDKLNKKNLLRSLGLNTLNQLELSLNKKQKLIFEEIFLRQADPVFDRNLLFKSAILKPYKEDLFNAFLAFEYRNNISFTKLLYFFDCICEICQQIESDNPKTYEKTLEFKMLIKTLTEMFEYFCSKLSNLNTEYLLMLDDETEQIAYLSRFLSRKKRQELTNSYIKVNGYFDKQPSEEVIGILDLREFNINPVNQTKQDTKKKKKGNNDFSNKVLASLKIIKKIDNLQKRVQEMTELFEKIIKSREYTLSTKAKLKIGKTVVKISDNVTKQAEVDNTFRKEFEEFLIMFLQVPSLIHKAILKKLRQRYEQFIQEHKVQGRAEVFKLITQNLQTIFMSDDTAKQLQGLSLNLPNKGSTKAMDLKVKYEEDEDEEDYEDEEEEEDDDEDEDGDGDGDGDGDEEFTFDEKEPSYPAKMKVKKMSLTETIVQTKEITIKKVKKGNLEDTRIMLEDHFRDMILDSATIVDPTQIDTYLININSVFHETSNHIMSSLVNMSNDEIDELVGMLNNIIRNLALNWLVYLNDTNKAIHEIKGLLQNYRKFLKVSDIFSRFSYQIFTDGSNHILGSSFLPVNAELKSEIIEYDAKVLKHPMTNEIFYDIEYFFKLKRLDVEDQVAYINSFGDLICTNKVRASVFAKLKEEAQDNPSLKLYGYSSELTKGNNLKHLVVSYEEENGINHFIILPATLNTVPL